MNRILTKKLLLFVSIITTPAFANNCQILDQQLTQALRNAEESSNYNDHPNEEKLNTANQQIASIIENFANDSVSITCPFSEAQHHQLRVLTSLDKRFRAFSWDDNSGGTMHYFNLYMQFVDDNGHNQVKGIQDGGMVTSLFTTWIKNKPLYLLATTGVYSTGYAGQSLNLYQIQDDKLISPKLIKTKDGVTDKLSFAYNFFSVVDRPERPIKLFEFDEKSKTIRFPVVVEDKYFANGKVTNRFINYKFDGNYFIRK